MANIKDIKAQMKGYRNTDQAARDVQTAITHHKDLKPGNETFVHPTNKKEELFRLKGTIPVAFRGTKYNIPIIIWLQKTHPQVNPIVYVNPTPEMSINQSRYVDVKGRVYLPYLSEWKQGTSDIATLVQILSATFAENIPVFSRQQQQTGYTPPNMGGAYRPPSYHPGYLPPPPMGAYNAPGFPPPPMGGGYNAPPPGPGYPPYVPGGAPPYPPSSQATPYPVGQSVMPTPGGIPPYGAPYPSPINSYHQPGIPPPVAAQPMMSAEEERKKIEEEEREKAKMRQAKLDSAISAVEEKIKRQLENVLQRAEDEMKTLNNSQTKLKENNEKLTILLRDMESKQNEVDQHAETLREKTAELESVIEYLKSQPTAVNIDDMVTATNVVHNQILRLYAEENAIDDTIYYLGEALRRDVITYEVFLKHVRDLARKQFMARATIMKARDTAKLPPHGIPG